MKNFIKLDFQAQNNLIKAKGVHLMTVSEKNHCYTLYSIDGYLVERCFNPSLAKFESIKTAGFGDLDRYLPLITLYDIYWI